MSWIKEILDPKARHWEQFYRGRWEHDRVVRSTHGNNCTGGCSWLVYVKDGLVGWEMQALDYPDLEPGGPGYEPRGCQRGICYSWYIYSPLRIKHPYVRGALLDLWREARARHADPVEAWSSIVGDEAKRRRYQESRGHGGFRRSSWAEALEIVAASLLHTAKTYGPDRVIGFSPVPAMSMLSYAAGTRFLHLFGGAALSFYDLYGDLPTASPETWGEKTDSSESADWFNSKLIAVAGSNLNMTRTPDAHFAVEARYRGAKLVVLSPDLSQVARHADWWLPVRAGTDAAFWLAACRVILEEFFVAREVPYFIDYLKRYADAPFLITLEKSGESFRAGRFLRAGRLGRYAGVENGDWKFVVLDAGSGQPRMPRGSIGFRWQTEKGGWNLRLEDGLDGSAIDPLLSLAGVRDDVLRVTFDDHVGGSAFERIVPVKYVETRDGRAAVATVFDLLAAELGVARGLPDEAPSDRDDAASPFSPAWQEKHTGLGRTSVVEFARQWARTAELTRGRCSVIIGSGSAHWYHGDLNYRGPITALVLCGCVGVSGGGLNHYTGQEKVTPAASHAVLSQALDWPGVPRLQNAPSFHYVHSDQWRYEEGRPGTRPGTGIFGQPHTMDIQAAAVRLGWLPFYPQFDRNPLDLVKEAEAEGAATGDEIAALLVRRLETDEVRFAVDDPDAPANWPRVWIIWRGNALLSSAKGHEYFLKHYLGTRSNAVAAEAAEGSVRSVIRRPAPTGKLDLVVDLNFRLDTTALYSDVVLPSAGWYEKEDLNTTDLHTFIHPFGEAVPPCWESKTDWEIFKALAGEVDRLAPAHFPRPFRDVVAHPLLHDSPDEIAQSEVRDWRAGEAPAVPGRTMPHLSVVERDYRTLHDRFVSFGPRVRDQGVEDRGVRIPVADLYDRRVETGPVHEWNGRLYPSLETAREAADVLLAFGAETNGEVAYRGFETKSRDTGLDLVDLGKAGRDVRLDFQGLTVRPRRILTSPCWSGLIDGGRPYVAFEMNVRRLVPWRTLTGRQHLYLDHEAYRVFGESLPTFKPPLDTSGALARSLSRPAGPSLVLNCLTPHGKWHMHTTYHDNLRMLTLSRGLEPLWLGEDDARALEVGDNDWVEILNDDGVVLTRAVVSARIPRGFCFLYHGQERTIDVPRSAARGGRRAGADNSLIRLRLNPVLMAGGYGQHCYRFNDYGPTTPDRDVTVIVRKLAGRPAEDGREAPK